MNQIMNPTRILIHLIQLAGSALTQGVGKLDEWDKWKPQKRNKNYKWLLLNGAMNPPESVNVSTRRKSGNFLRGVNHDMRNVEDYIFHHPNLGKIVNKVTDWNMEKRDAIKKIKIFLVECRRTNSIPVIYYTGHGQIGTGMFCCHFMC